MPLLFGAPHHMFGSTTDLVSTKLLPRPCKLHQTGHTLHLHRRNPPKTNFLTQMSPNFLSVRDYDTSSHTTSSRNSRRTYGRHGKRRLRPRASVSICVH